MDTYSVGSYNSSPFLDMPLNHKVFLAQFETIKKIADRESCVIVGRCADYALADYPDCINIFIHSDMENRVKAVSKRLNITENKAKDLIQKRINNAPAIIIIIPASAGVILPAII